MKHHLPTDTRQPPTARACAAFLEAYRARRATPNYEALARAICERWPLDPEQTARFARLALAGRAEMLDPRAPQWRAAAILLDVSLAGVLGPALSAVRPLPPERQRAAEEVEEAVAPSPEPKVEARPEPGPQPRQATKVNGPHPMTAQYRRCATEAAPNLRALMTERGIGFNDLVSMLATVAPERTITARRMALAGALRGTCGRSWVWAAIIATLRVHPSSLCSDDRWSDVLNADYAPRTPNARQTQHARVAALAAHVVASRRLDAIMRERGMSTADLIGRMVETGRLGRRSDTSTRAISTYNLRRRPSYLWAVAAEALGVDLGIFSSCRAWLAMAAADRTNVPGSAHMTECAARAASSVMSICATRGMSPRDVARAIARLNTKRSWRVWYSNVDNITRQRRPTVSITWPAIAAALGVGLSDLCDDPVWCALQSRYEDIDET